MRLRPGGLVTALAATVIAWRCAATLFERTVHAAEEPLAARARWLFADRDARIASTFGADAAIVHALEARLEPGDVVLLYAVPREETVALRDRLVLLQIRLNSLFYPTRTVLAVGPFANAESFTSLLTPRMWLLNVTPDVDRPLPERFETVVRGDGFELSQSKGAP